MGVGLLLEDGAEALQEPELVQVQVQVQDQGPELKR